jgi:hypothetical protein
VLSQITTSFFPEMRFVGCCISFGSYVYSYKNEFYSCWFVNSSYQDSELNFNFQLKVILPLKVTDKKKKHSLGCDEFQEEAVQQLKEKELLNWWL